MLKRLLHRPRHHRRSSPTLQAAATGDQTIAEPESLCQRCTDINFMHRLRSDDEPYSWWYEAHNDNTPVRAYVEYLSQNAFNLGKHSDIKFENKCSACCILKSLISSRTWDSKEELFLISAWAIERIEQSIDIARRGRPGPSRPDWDIDGYQGDEVKYAKLLYIARKIASPTQYWTFAHEAQEALTILDQTSNAPAFGGRKVKKDIDFEQLISWVNICIESHSDTCALISAPELISIRLIDVKKREVITYFPGAEYICLSYVWGDVRQGNQSLGKLRSRLPATIEDAMSVARSLGKRYLWVDSICIEQENNSHKIAQINLMGLIYRCAWVTIVALSGDSANCGLGRFNSRLPSIPQGTCHVGGVGLVTLMPTLEQQISRSKWGKRAWTLQEGQLSARCLYFTQHQVYFECMSGQCSESVQDCEAPRHRWDNSRKLITRYSRQHLVREAPGVFRQFVSLGKGLGISDSAFLTLYDEHVREYMSRKLTYESDILNAISGLLKQLQEKCPSHFGGGFFWGLPVDALPFALMWYESGSSHKRSGMPTWSWAHCEGPLARIVVIPKDSQHGPHDNTRPPVFWVLSFESRYFIKFRRVDKDIFKTIYAANPPSDSFNQFSWGNKDRVSNLAYTWTAHHIGRHILPCRDPNSLLFVEGLIFRPILSQIISDFEPDKNSPSEEHVFNFLVGESLCRLTCYTKEISEHIRTTYKQQLSQPICLLILHREFHHYFWYYDLLLLDYNACFSTRLGPLKLRFPTSTRREIFEAFRPAWAELAIA